MDMLDSIKPLIDSNLISEETRNEISEAWEAKLEETRNAVRTELREEFAERYEHDKHVMVEALDKMVTDNLSREIAEFVEDKKNLATERVAYKRNMTEHAKLFNKFLVKQLTKEVKELHGDRGLVAENFKKMEDFIIKQLAREINEFNQDKTDLSDTKVRLVKEGRKQLANLKGRFIKRASKVVFETVSKRINKEMSQLRGDINQSRENMFGRRIFEAYAAEFSTSHLNENAEINKLNRLLNQKDQKLAESITTLKKAEIVVNSKNRQIAIQQRQAIRENTMYELLSPLSKEKASMMSELLENVQTDRLRKAYDRYLPSLLSESGRTPPKRRETRQLSETRKTGPDNVYSTADGERKQSRQVTEVMNSNKDNVIELKRLAGVK